jgi:hypothetical protein
VQLADEPVNANGHLLTFCVCVRCANGSYGAGALCRISRATAIQPSGDLTQECVSVRSARGLWRGR